MPITGPRGAEPTQRGWINPRTGELLKSQKIGQKDIDEWYGRPAEVTAVPAVEEPDADDVVVDLNSDGIIDQWESMTKRELEEYGRDHGIELDRRKNKASMIAELREHIS